jgi:preprotein translocase subunit SecD
VFPTTDEGERLAVADALLLSGADVTCVGLAGAPDDAPAAGPNVRLVFDGAQRDRLTAVTTAHVGDRIALVLNGKALMAPRLRDPITRGEVVVYGQPGWDAAALRDAIHRDAGVPICPAA